MKILWQTRYETGISAVDGDHRRLVDLINQLDSLLEGGGELGRVGGVIDALVDYADYHFAREEAMMAEAGYDGSELHAESHAHFGEFLGGLVGNCMLEPSRETAVRIRDFLSGWLVDHILLEDMKFAPVLRAVA